MKHVIILFFGGVGLSLLLTASGVEHIAWHILIGGVWGLFYSAIQED